jgi:hypothetical protein
VEIAFQQTGFVRSKRYGVPKSMRSGYLPVEEGVPHTMVSDDELLGEKRSPWVSLREALDQDHEVERRSATKLVQKVEQVTILTWHIFFI